MHATMIVTSSYMDEYANAGVSAMSTAASASSSS